MSNYLNIPDDLLSLIEKREQDDRRVAERRLEGELPTDETICRERREGERRSEAPRREDDN